MFKLHNLKAPIGSNHAPKRKGLGMGSGLGKTAGKGHKGQLARSGGSIHPVFEGGQVPHARRMPKVGFKSPLKQIDHRVNVAELGEFAGKDLTTKDLLPKTLRTKTRCRVSVYGSRLPAKLPTSLEAHHVSASVQKLLEGKGVKVTVVALKDGSKPRVSTRKRNTKQA
ncbi:MAG: 50S ribosomal protein L15 [Bdellovibrionota bacterium]